MGLHLSRLKWLLKHAYDTVETYHAEFQAAEIHPDDAHCGAEKLGYMVIPVSEGMRPPAKSA